jgi:transcription elongation factor Elf1
MAEAESKSVTKSKKSALKEVTFKCRLCEKQKPISEMKIIRRFRPVIIVCRDCEKSIY